MLVRLVGHAWRPAPFSRSFPHFRRLTVPGVWHTATAVIGAGTIISPIIKVVTTVAILAAIYFLFVRPILDTTEDITNDVTGNIAKSQQQSNQASAQAQQQATAAEIESARNEAASYARSLLAGSQPWPEASKAVLECTKDAGSNNAQLDRCSALGQRISSSVLSNRNFAVSYADNLETQGKTAEAEQVRDCVEKAEFEAKDMAKCRSLANKLLFG